MRLLRTLREGIADLDETIEEAAAAHPDFFIFESLAGAGPLLAPRLSAAFGSRRERYQPRRGPNVLGDRARYREEREKQLTQSRWACPKFLRQRFHEWAGHSIEYSVWARSYYWQQARQRRGPPCGRWEPWPSNGRVVFGCWQDRAYDESKYLAALARRGSPLVAAAAIAKTK